MPESWQFIDYSGVPSIKWGKLAGYLGKGTLYAAIWAVIHQLVAITNGITDAMGQLEATASRFARGFFTAEPITAAFQSAAGAIPNHPLGIVLAFAIVVTAMWAVTKVTEVV